jgi:hypothetical protein
MWPFSEMSLSTASLVGTIANWGLLVSLLAGLFSTFVIVKTTDVKEDHWETARRESGERIVALTTQGDEAKATLGVAQADIAKASAKIADANARAAEAERQNLDLRAKIASRRITGEQHELLVREISKLPGLFDIAVMGDPESALFASDILKTLGDAGWTVGARELPLGEIWTGLVLLQTDDPAARRILDALLKAKIPVSIGDDAHKRPMATIMVGNKPSLF